VKFQAILAIGIFAGVGIMNSALAGDHLKVGISGGDGEEIWARVQEIAKREGLDVEVRVYAWGVDYRGDREHDYRCEPALHSSRKNL